MKLPSFEFEDLSAAFSVALLALPLSLGIAVASGFPPMSGIITVAVGGLVTLFAGRRSFLIKGPAAGLITIMLGAYIELEQVTRGQGLEATLAIACVAGVLQICTSRLSVSKWVAKVPSPVIVGMLLAIGVSILRTQLPLAFGMRWEELPTMSRPGDTIVGGTVLAMVLAWSFAVPERWRKSVPAPVVAIAAGIVLSLCIAGCYPAQGLDLPSRPLAGLPRPNFMLLAHPVAWRWLLVLAAVGTVESALTTQMARELCEPEARIDPDRDLLWVGIGNVIGPLLGGIPMISEVVRSTANHEQGARSSLSGALHAALVLLPVLLIPMALRWIPVSALAAVIVAAGFQLMSPRRWWHMRHHRLDVATLAVTVVVSVYVDLLVGVGIGLALHLGVESLLANRRPQSPTTST